MKRFVLFFAAFVAVFSLVGAQAASPNGNKLRCFDGTTDGGYGGTCTVTDRGVASLNTTDGNPNGSYAGVYIVPGLPGKPIGNVNKLAFSYSCSSAATCVRGGSPRISIPIDENGDGTTDTYAFIDANNCGQAGATSGTVDLNCPVFEGSTLYPNWAAFVAAHPTYRIGSDALAFVIVDQPFLGTVSNVQLGKGPAH